ncbi:hypothetical protein O181_038041 [Austropuccinia psidii MF-1]|uniref:Retroviral polymerase SH3-like domain-containing protein n=1 Tax=Austropuccinia psidii MF-1 TaxID=1389203 RepID=A0A9Q3HBB1_9BASI|nr:hypothetical protein [Austropuccinia psidii MF-1]
MEPPGQPGILIGYDNDNTAYRIVWLSDTKVLVTHHEAFNETLFPFLSARTENTLSPPLDLNITTPTPNNEMETEATETCKLTAQTVQDIEENNDKTLPTQQPRIKIMDLSIQC